MGALGLAWLPVLRGAGLCAWSAALAISSGHDEDEIWFQRFRGLRPARGGQSQLQRLRAILPLVWALVRPRLPALAAGLLLILISRLSGLVLPATARIFVDDVLAGSQPERMRILVLDKGRVIERGTCADLLRVGGRYAVMLEQQTLPAEVAAGVRAG